MRIGICNPQGTYMTYQSHAVGKYMTGIAIDETAAYVLLMNLRQIYATIHLGQCLTPD